jgi:hypothetical protein
VIDSGYEGAQGLSSYESLFDDSKVPLEVAPNNGTEGTGTFRLRLVNRLLMSDDFYSEEQINEMLTGTEEYRDDIILALELLTIRHPRMALFVVGRTLEDTLMKYFRKKRFKGTPAIKKNKMDFDSVIRFLGNNKGVLTQSTTEKMLSLKWDRNVGGHPASDVEIQQLQATSKQMFEMGVLLVKGVIKLINKTATRI